MLTTDDLYDEALGCRQAFPNRRGESLHVYLWDHVRKNDWGFRAVNGLTSRETHEGTLHTAWWAGDLGCFGWLVACVLLVPTVGMRNLLVTPLYERRITAVVRKIG